MSTILSGFDTEEKGECACPECGGDGHISEESFGCPVCFGTGYKVVSPPVPKRAMYMPKVLYKELDAEDGSALWYIPCRVLMPTRSGPGSFEKDLYLHRHYDRLGFWHNRATFNDEPSGFFTSIEHAAGVVAAMSASSD